MKTSHLELKVKLVVKSGERQDLREVVDNLDYDFVVSPDEDAHIEDMEILDWEVTDSR